MVKNLLILCSTVFLYKAALSFNMHQHHTISIIKLSFKLRAYITLQLYFILVNISLKKLVFVFCIVWLHIAAFFSQSTRKTRTSFLRGKFTK